MKVRLVITGRRIGEDSIIESIQYIKELRVENNKAYVVTQTGVKHNIGSTVYGPNILTKYILFGPTAEEIEDDEEYDD